MRVYKLKPDILFWRFIIASNIQDLGSGFYFITGKSKSGIYA